MHELSHIDLYISSMSLFGLVNSVYKDYFGTLPPTRACVALHLPAGVHIMIDAIAHVSSDLKGKRRAGLHVQSMSYWAPANIGPYSQAITVRLLVTDAHKRTSVDLDGV